MDQHELLATWLRDARSMEKALANFSEKAAEDFNDHPEIKERLKGFADRSKQSQAEMDTSLDSLNEESSGGKDLLGKLIGYVSGVGSSIYKDKMIKDLLVLHGAFHFAHASYVSLAHGAKVEGNDTLSMLCNRLAEEREEMARWVAEHIPKATEAALIREDG